MVGDFFLLDWTEGPEPYMQGYKSDAYPFLPDTFKQFFGKMKSRRGRRGRTRVLGVNGLITVLIFQALSDLVG